MAYATLAELVDAYKTGQLARHDKLWVDNDDAYVYVGDANCASVSPPVFNMHPGQILEEALNLLGVPHEGV